MDAAVDVERLVARCELRGATGSRAASCAVVELAELTDGRTVLLRSDRGFTTQLREVGVGALSTWPSLTAADVEQLVRDVVLPDDAEETGEDLDLGVYAQALRDAGVAVVIDELRTVPFVVVLDDAVQAQLGPPPAPPGDGEPPQG